MTCQTPSSAEESFACRARYEERTALFEIFGLIIGNEGRETSGASMTLDLGLERLDAWLAAHDDRVSAEARRDALARFEWEYRPGHIEPSSGRVVAQPGVIAPGYVDQFIADGGDVIRRRAGAFETYTGERNNA